MAPKKLGSLPPVYLETLAVFEAFRRLGISSADIYFGFGHVQNVGLDIVYVQAKQGDKTFVFHTGQLFGAPSEKVFAIWQKACELWNTAPEEETRPIWEGSMVKAQATELVLRMSEKGFVFPDRSAN